MLELYYNFFTRFCVVNKFEELEMDTDLLYLALAERELEACIRPEMRAEWQRLRSNDCVDSFSADAVATFSPRTREDSERTITLLSPMNKLRKVYSTFIQKEYSKLMEFTLNRLICKIFTHYSFYIVYLSNLFTLINFLKH